MEPGHRAGAAPDRLHVVAFKLGHEGFCAPTRAIREIRGWTGCMPLPNAPDHVRGVIDLRGLVVPIVDLGRWLGRGAVEISERSAIIVAEIETGVVGLLVDEVSDMLGVPAEAVQPLPDMHGLGSRVVLAGILALESGMIGLLDLGAICRGSAPVPKAADAEGALPSTLPRMTSTPGETPSAFAS